ncbi:MAG: hypothetical protein U0354_08950 [Candidatus Sericytochromatia bacterium]
MRIKNKKILGVTLTEILVSTSVISFVMIISSNLLFGVKKTQDLLNASSMEREISYNTKQVIKNELSGAYYFFPSNYTLPPGFLEGGDTAKDDRYILPANIGNNYEKGLTFNVDLANKSNISTGGKLDTEAGQYKFIITNGDSLYFVKDQFIDADKIIGNDNLNTNYPVPSNTKIHLQSVNYLYFRKSPDSKKNVELVLFQDKYFFRGESVSILPTLTTIPTASLVEMKLPVVTFESSASPSYSDAHKYIYRRNLLYRLYLKGYKMAIEDKDKPYYMFGTFPPADPITNIIPSEIPLSTQSIMPPTQRSIPLQKFANYSLSDVLVNQKTFLQSTFDISFLTLSPTLNGILALSLPSAPLPNPVTKRVVSKNISIEPIIDNSLVKLGGESDQAFKIRKIQSRVGILFKINKDGGNTNVVNNENVANFKQVDSNIKNIQVDLNLYVENSSNSNLENRFSQSFSVETLSNRKLY